MISRLRWKSRRTQQVVWYPREVWYLLCCCCCCCCSFRAVNGLSPGNNNNENNNHHNLRLLQQDDEPPPSPPYDNDQPPHVVLKSRAMIKDSQMMRTSNYHTSDFGARKNHPTSYDPSPPFLGPIHLAHDNDEENDNDNDNDGVSSWTKKKKKERFDLGRERIRHYYERRNLFDPLQQQRQKRSNKNNNDTTPPLNPSSPTKQKLQAIVDYLAYHNAPVDVKEVCESVEFILRTRKRLLGAAAREQRRRRNNDNSNSHQDEIMMNLEPELCLYDLCCGHGLTGLLFACCWGGCGGIRLNKVILVDQTRPPSHTILRDLLTQLCPWIGEGETAISGDSCGGGGMATFQVTSLDSITSLTDVSASASSSSSVLSSSSSCRVHKTNNHNNHDDEEEEDSSDNKNNNNNNNIRTVPLSIPIVISTHACGTLTDRVLELACHSHSAAAAIAVLPCCYTGTSQGTPYGIVRALGVAWASDIQRSFYLRRHGYHVDFSAIPNEITPMNRILLGERQQQQSSKKKKKKEETTKTIATTNNNNHGP